jgi:hypothetical protein
MINISPMLPLACAGVEVDDIDRRSSLPVGQHRGYDAGVKWWGASCLAQTHLPDAHLNRDDQVDNRPSRRRTFGLAG